jgi:NADH:ubiquinone oxidoreductase subunit 2 (subunit N)
MKINLVELTYYTVFLETFLSITAIYSIIVCTLLKNNISNILIQNKLSDCFGFILFMSCFLVLNDTLQLSPWLSEFYPCTDVSLPLYDYHLGFNNCVIVDGVSIFSKTLICFFSSLFFYIISDYLKENRLTYEFVILLLFAIIGLILLCSTNDLLLAFLSFELVSLVSYILAAFKKNSKYSIEAGIKYLIVGAISASFFLLGTSFFYFHTGTTIISDIYMLFCDFYKFKLVESSFYPIYSVFNICNLLWLHYDVPHELLSLYPYEFAYLFFNDLHLHYLVPNIFFVSDFFFGMIFDVWFYNRCLIDICYRDVFLNDLSYKSSIMEIGLLLILLSLFIKLAVSPFHLWSLEVYENSPTISTFFFVAITKLSFFVLLFRISYSLMDFYQATISYSSVVVGLLSIFIGSFGNLRQRKIKTIFAYSSINHMGYLLVCFGTCSSFSIEIIFFYLVTYMLSNIILWYVILTLQKAKSNYKNKKSVDLGDIALLNKSNKSLAFGLLVVLFSIAGIPPFVGFLAKIGIFLELINKEFYFIATFSIFCSMISTFYYIRLIKILYFENITVGKLYLPVNSDKSIIFCFLVFTLIFLFFKPTLLYLFVHKVALEFGIGAGMTTAVNNVTLMF